MMFQNEQTISWSIEQPLPKSQSIAGLMLMLTPRAPEHNWVFWSLWLKTFPFTFTFASFGKRKQKDPKCRLVLKISLTKARKSTDLKIRQKCVYCNLRICITVSCFDQGKHYILWLLNGLFANQIITNCTKDQMNSFSFISCISPM